MTNKKRNNMLCEYSTRVSGVTRLHQTDFWYSVFDNAGFGLICKQNDHLGQSKQSGAITGIIKIEISLFASPATCVHIIHLYSGC